MKVHWKKDRLAKDIKITTYYIYNKSNTLASYKSTLRLPIEFIVNYI